jgi:hypothetical protein
MSNALLAGKCKASPEIVGKGKKKKEKETKETTQKHCILCHLLFRVT